MPVERAESDGGDVDGGYPVRLVWGKMIMRKRASGRSSPKQGSSDQTVVAIVGEIAKSAPERGRMGESRQTGTGLIILLPFIGARLAQSGRVFSSIPAPYSIQHPAYPPDPPAWAHAWHAYAGVRAPLFQRPAALRPDQSLGAGSSRAAVQPASERPTVERLERLERQARTHAQQAQPLRPHCPLPHHVRD